MITTTNHEKDDQLIEDEAISFVMQFNEEVQTRFSPDQIINTDQSGFNYLHYGNRTLSFTGEKDTKLVVDNFNLNEYQKTKNEMKNKHK